MTKQGGMGDNFYIGGVDVSGDIQSLSRIGGGPALIDSTGIDKGGHERLGGLIDGALTFTTFFNDTGVHTVTSLLPRTDAIMSYWRGTALGGPAASMVAKQPGYDGTRANDGAFTFAVGAVSNGFGIQWGNGLTSGKRTDTTATNGASVDFLASSAFGLTAYLHVFAFTGTSVTVKIQESSDNGAGDAFVDVVGGTFTAATGVTSERISTASGLTV